MAVATSRSRFVTLDALSARWRVALDSAQEALLATTSCPTPVLPPEEVRDRSTRLTQERDNVSRLLDADARVEHVKLIRRLTAPHASKEMLGLPRGVVACVFDLDGVLTGSATIHAEAWQETFDGLLARRVERSGERFAPFAPFSNTDYTLHIHGRARLDGVRAFLASRGIRLPEGTAGDPPDTETVHGLANRKNRALLRRLDQEGVSAFDGSRLFLEDAREAGLRCAVVSASANTRRILERAQMWSLVDVCIDGNTIRSERLRGKPEPDTVLAACERLGVQPAQAAVFETTDAGVAAGVYAKVGLVVAVDRTGRSEPFRAEGANVVVSDLSDLLDPRLKG
jgi:beta-phosphoglucomutase family hydrolase